MKYATSDRPWLNLYGIRVRAVAAFSSVFSNPDTALIHRCLPDELLFEIFAKMGPYSLGRAACVCRKWKYMVRNQSLWRNACLKTWQRHGVEANCQVVQTIYGGSWRKMWLYRPRVRTDGIYVSRNTYIRTGAASFSFSNTVNVVCYFRYLRFYASGKFLYMISSEKIRDVVKFMHFRGRKDVYKGDYNLEDDVITTAFLYPGGNRHTMHRMRLRLRGTTSGANNRVDILKILTTGVDPSEIKSREDNMLSLVEGWDEDETHDPDIPAISHTRGMTTFVFVPFEEAETSVLNLPVESMDYFVPG